MTETPFYRLKKPGENEFYDVADANGNMDKIDTALHTKAEKAIPDDAVSAVKFTLGVENGKLYMMEV